MDAALAGATLNSGDAETRGSPEKGYTRDMGPVRFERTTSRLSAGCTTGYATGPGGFTLQHLAS